VACALNAFAGYIDGIGYIHLGSLFISFMSGNATRLGVSAAAAVGRRRCRHRVLLCCS
jgi:uncharacterized membrane protein YoaK (UPF0700 family)